MPDEGSRARRALAAVESTPADASGLADALLGALGPGAGDYSAGLAVARTLAASDVGSLTGIGELLKAEAERQLHVLPARSETISRLILAVGQELGRADMSALGEMSLADALRDQGHYAAALVSYDRAGELYRARGDQVGWARTRIGAAAARRVMGELTQALAEAEEARDVLATHQVWMRLARAESVIGLVLRELGRYPEALGAYGRARMAAERLDSEERELMSAEVLVNEAVINLRIDDYPRAEGDLRLAAEIFESHGRLAPMAQAEANRARVLAAQGHVSQALALVREVSDTLRRLGRGAEAAMVGQVGVQCWMLLNRPLEASALADELVAELTTSSAGNELARTLLDRALAREELGFSEDASADLDQAEALFAASRSSGWVALVQLRRAELLQRVGSWPAALEAARSAYQGLDREHQRVARARARLVEAHAERALDHPEAARAAARFARVIGRRHGVPWLVYGGWRLAGELAPRGSAETARPEALYAFGRAIAALEESQGRILVEQRPSFLRDKLGVYEEAIRVALDHGQAQRAFRFAERAKARALLDALGLRALDVRVRPRTAAAQALVHELDGLRQRRNRLTDALAAQPLIGPALGPAVDLARVQQQLAVTEARMASVLEELRLGEGADPERLALLQGRVHSPLRRFGPRTALVEYVAVGERLAIFVLRRGRPIAALWAPHASALTVVAQLRAQLDFSLGAASAARDDPAALAALGTHTRGILRRLYELLLLPVRAELDGVARLVVVPHGVLHYLPFAALHDGQQYLVEQLEVVLAPSASTVAFSRQPTRHAQSRALVVSHSGGGVLSGAAAEADLVSELYGGRRLAEEQATPEAVRAASVDADVVHIAAHGMSRPDAPLFSHVQLEHGQLTALDLLQLELDCSLVTLSACETGRAVVVPGDDLVGLSRSLLYAGARSVVQSLWRVDDRATRRFMGVLYRALRRGAGRGAAVRAAQRSLLNDESAIGLDHPFFWAAFSLVGDWSPIGSAPADQRSAGGAT